MKNLQKALLAVIAGSVMTMSAQAAMNYAGQPYVGAKVGQYSIDVSDIDDAFSYGVYGGYKFTNQFGIEAEYLATNDGDIDVNDAEVDDFIDEITNGFGLPQGVTLDANREYSASVLGLYGTYDYAFPNTALYAKGRLGVAKNKIDIDTNIIVSDGITTQKNSVSESISDTGVAGGLGLGYNFGPMASVEAMYNFYPEVDDVNVNGITLGAHFKF
ncbi:porin family protein [Psychrobacter sp. T6-5]|uniref:porin family protein n=1 Tax=Psychrobacter sp. T6-5 TaxID=3457451 RepID=UPI003FD12F14